MAGEISPSSTFYLTLLSSVKLYVEDWPNFCGRLRISELKFHSLNFRFRNDEVVDHSYTTSGRESRNVHTFVSIIQ